jgi:hypothetical protein
MRSLLARRCTSLGRQRGLLLAPKRKRAWARSGRRTEPFTSPVVTLRTPLAAAEVIRYAVEDLRTPRAFGAWLQVGDERFNSVEIQRLYEDGEYPLRKSASD